MTHQRSKMKNRRDASSPAIRERAKQLRAEMAVAERKLWDRLRRRQLDGLKFRRQHPIGPFIVDFCCPAHNLIVEVDGAIHTEQEGQDANRTQELEKRGYTVIRFPNEQILNHIEHVCTLIAAECEKNKHAPSS